MRRLDFLPLALLGGLIGTYLVGAAVGWFLLHHGFVLNDLLLPRGQGFWGYLGGRLFAWDAQWYEVIARHGYSWDPTSPARQSIAFFPLWGLLTRPIYRLVGFHPHVWVLLLTLVVAYASIHVFFQMGRRLVGGRAAVIATVLYVFFPAGHFLLQSYPTGLMNLIVLLVLRDLIAGREWRPALLAGIATAAGPLMVVTGFTVWLVAAWRRRDRFGWPATLGMLLGLGLLGLTGLMAFVGWQAVALHDPLAFLAAQRPWDQHHSLPARLWRFVWMIAVVPDFLHLAHLIVNIRDYIRMRDYVLAYVRYEFVVDFLFMALLMVGLFWTIHVKPRVVLVFGCVAMVFYVWFHGTTHNGLSMMRLVYICLPAFWGWGRALQRERGWTYGAVGLSVAALLVQEVFSDIGQLVL